MHFRLSKSRPVAIGAVLATALFGLPVPAQAEPAKPPAPAGRAALASPDQALGAGWRGSSDVLVTGSGDTDGYHLFVAREKDAFAWSTLATLGSSALEVGPWMGEVCVTGSGRYAVAVFAPKKAANKPHLMMAGGLAAVVDTTTGKATHVATGVQLSYFTPACGPGDRALLTRAVGTDLDRDTELLTVDAAAGKVTRTRRIDGQLTTPAPAPDGDYAVAGDQLVKVSETGQLTKLGKLQGQTFGVRATAGHGVDVVSVKGKEAVAERFTGGKLITTATGPVGKVQLFAQRDGGNALVGEVSMRAAAPGLRAVASDRRVEAISAQGHLLAEDVYSSQSGRSVGQPLRAVSAKDAGSIVVTVRAAASGRRTSSTVARTAAPELDVDVAAAPDKGRPAKAGARAAAAAGVGEPTCAVPRNDPTVQPLQPSPDQVEWAIDQAVHGRLMVTRPANYLKAGLAEYKPQELIRRKDLIGGGTVPANVILGIVAQETNMSQASWHVVPGDTGNPLIGSYYGNEGNLDVINYANTDCGYGIGQVTDGMRADSSQWTYTQKRAIAVDYATNIAASINILIEKWNQLKSEPVQYQTFMNNNEPQFIENWFVALWAYNSGFYPYSTRNSNPKQKGRWGIGWLNNPANKEYPADRAPFLRLTMADAEHPNRWSYPERIMGWIESPQFKGYPIATRAYSTPNYGGNGPLAGPGPAAQHVLPLPDKYAFCSTVNSCSKAANGCPAVSEACWWYGPAGSAECRNDECSRENLAFALGSAEPGVKRIYDRECETFNEWKDPARDATRKVSVVFDLNDTSQYNLGCTDVGQQNGKFTLRLGDPAGSEDVAPYAAIDLHQIGAGYKGHSWFTYMYPKSDVKRKVVGSWTPELDLKPGERTRYSIVAHLPNHGADGIGDYFITAGSAISATYECRLDFEAETQSDIPGVLGKGKWVYLGNYELGRGAQVQLSNVGIVEFKGNDSVAWDAMAFVPTGTRTGPGCKQDYPQ